jgi:hypothetical protein
MLLSWPPLNSMSAAVLSDSTCPWCCMAGMRVLAVTTCAGVHAADRQILLHWSVCLSVCLCLPAILHYSHLAPSQRRIQTDVNRSPDFSAKPDNGKYLVQQVCAAHRWQRSRPSVISSVAHDGNYLVPCQRVLRAAGGVPDLDHAGRTVVQPHEQEAALQEQRVDLPADLHAARALHRRRAS